MDNELMLNFENKIKKLEKIKWKHNNCMMNIFIQFYLN